jgi:hypothetical protein
MAATAAGCRLAEAGEGGPLRQERGGRGLGGLRH